MKDGLYFLIAMALLIRNVFSIRDGEYDLPENQPDSGTGGTSNGQRMWRHRGKDDLCGRRPRCDSHQQRVKIG